MCFSDFWQIFIENLTPHSIIFQTLFKTGHINFDSMFQTILRHNLYLFSNTLSPVVNTVHNQLSQTHESGATNQIAPFVIKTLFAYCNTEILTKALVTMKTTLEACATEMRKRLCDPNGKYKVNSSGRNKLTVVSWDRSNTEWQRWQNYRTKDGEWKTGKSGLAFEF